jgi:hypothetical protein
MRQRRKEDIPKGKGNEVTRKKRNRSKNKNAMHELKARRNRGNM